MKRYVHQVKSFISYQDLYLLLDLEWMAVNKQNGSKLNDLPKNSNVKERSLVTVFTAAMLAPHLQQWTYVSWLS